MRSDFPAAFAGMMGCGNRTLVVSVLLPENGGGAVALICAAPERFARSYSSPKPPRKAILVLANTSHAKPRRGPKFFSDGFRNITGVMVGFASCTRSLTTAPWPDVSLIVVWIS